MLNRKQAEEWDRTHRAIDFDMLSDFDFPAYLPWEKYQQQAVVPEKIKALRDARVSVTGYMLPIDMEGQGVQRFVLVPYLDMCHWGMIGAANQWVLVTMRARTKFVGLSAVKVYGKFDVGEVLQNGMLQSFYRMNGDAVYSKLNP
jgi:hypothetical protein